MHFHEVPILVPSSCVIDTVRRSETPINLNVPYSSYLGVLRILIIESQVSWKSNQFIPKRSSQLIELFRCEIMVFDDYKSPLLHFLSNVIYLGKEVFETRVFISNYSFSIEENV